MNKIREYINEYINTHGKKRILSFVIGIAILASLALTVIIAQNQQTIRQRAAEPTASNLPLSEKQISCDYEISENICLKNHNFVSSNLVDAALQTNKTIVSENEIIEIEFKIKNKGGIPLSLFLEKPAAEEKSLHIFSSGNLTIIDAIPDNVPASDEINFKVKAKITPIFAPNGYFLSKLSLLYDKKEIGSLETVFFLKSNTVNQCALPVSTPGKCTSNNIFFAGASCISHQQCVRGACVNGYCAANSGQLVFPEYLDNEDFSKGQRFYSRTRHSFLEGNNRVLVLVDLSLDNQITKDKLNKSWEFINQWVDKHALKHIKEDVANFIFDVKFVDPKINGGNKNRLGEWAQAIAKRENINIEEYDLIFGFVPDELLISLCGNIVAAGCGGGGEAYIRLKDLKEDTDENLLSTILHEFLHVYGTGHGFDDYLAYETRADGRNVGQSSNYFELGSLERAEIGWGDVNRDGIIDIKQISKNLKDIVVDKISYEIKEIGEQKWMLLYIEIEDENGNLIMPTKSNPLVLKNLISNPDSNYNFIRTSTIHFAQVIDPDKDKSIPYSLYVEYGSVKKTLTGTCELKPSDATGACSVVLPTPTPTPTPTPSSTPNLCTVCSADVNKDGTVNTSDLNISGACLDRPTTGTCANADSNKDGRIDVLDTNCVGKNFGKKCTQPTPISIVNACTACSADVNKSEVVNIQDIAISSRCINKPIGGICANADVNKNGKIDGTDFNCVLKNYLKRC